MADPDGGRDVTIVTPWYPTPQLPYRGTFVRAMIEATAPGCDSMTSIHFDDLVVRMPGRLGSEIRAAHQVLAPMVAPVADPSGVSLRQVPVPLTRGLSYAEIARTESDAVRSALGGRPISSPIVHAHVGLSGGWEIGRAHV